MTPYHKEMIYDIHTHHHPATPGTAIVQLIADDFSPRPGHFYSVGIHPWEIREDWRTQQAKLSIMALHPQVLMIGEAGLDKKNGIVSMEHQIEVFRRHIYLSEMLHKPLIVHCVKAFDELLSLRKESKATQPWIVHGFRGGVEQWQQLTRAGLYVSIGSHHNAELIKKLVPQYLLLESDELDKVGDVYQIISCSIGVEIADLERYVDANIHRLFTAHCTE